MKRAHGRPLQGLVRDPNLAPTPVRESDVTSQSIRYTRGVLPADTTLAAQQAQSDVYRRLEPKARARLALDMSEAARELTRAGIRARHPDYGELEVEHALRRLVLGDELYRKAWPNRSTLDP